MTVKSTFDLTVTDAAVSQNPLEASCVPDSDETTYEGELQNESPFRMRVSIRLAKQRTRVIFLPKDVADESLARDGPSELDPQQLDGNRPTTWTSTVRQHAHGEQSLGGEQ